MHAFVEARRENPEKMKEWQESYKCLIQTASWPDRLSQKWRDLLAGTLQTLRKTVVETFKVSQTRVRTPYKIVLKSKFEKDNPGAIEREGLLVKAVKCDGKLEEVVYVRQLAKGEWLCDEEELTGTEHKEIYDDGEVSLNKNQQGNKFKMLAASKNRFEERGAGARDRH